MSIFGVMKIEPYQINNYISEPYENTQDPACLKHRTLVFSKPLASEALALWNNRSIRLTEQIALQDKHNANPESDDTGPSFACEKQ